MPDKGSTASLTSLPTPQQVQHSEVDRPCLQGGLGMGRGRGGREAEEPRGHVVQWPQPWKIGGYLMGCKGREKIPHDRGGLRDLWGGAFHPGRGNSQCTVSEPRGVLGACATGWPRCHSDRHGSQMPWQWGLGDFTSPCGCAGGRCTSGLGSPSGRWREERKGPGFGRGLRPGLPQGSQYIRGKVCLDSRVLGVRRRGGPGQWPDERPRCTERLRAKH